MRAPAAPSETSREASGAGADAAGLRLALRDWDWLTPLRLGEIPGAAITVVDDLPEDLVLDPRFDAVEMSFAQAVQRVARGDRNVVALPCFVMRGFRHHCALVRQDSGLRDFTALRGRVIGMTGWQDTGSIWTRGLLAEAGVDADSARFLIGRVNPGDPAASPLPADVPAGVGALEPDDDLLAALRAGRIDALFAPFAPADLHAPQPWLRPLLVDAAGAEADWARRHGFVPGLHVIGLRADALAARPALATEVPALLRRAQELWRARRLRFAETTPWLGEAFAKAARLLPPGFDRDGLAANRPMITAFCTLMQRQGLIPAPLGPDDIFPRAADTGR